MSDYNVQLHQAKNWQFVGFTALGVVTFAGSLFIPIKAGQVPVERLAIIALSGGFITVGKLVNDSKQDLDLKARVIEAGKTKVFVHDQSLATAHKLEVARIKREDELAKTIGVPEDVEYN